MICQNCKQRESVVHLTKIVNGQAIQTHLCQECAQKVQGFGFAIYPGMVSNFLQALFGHDPSSNSGQGIEEAQQTKCPGCERTFFQLQQAGRMGCSKCYDVFHPQMELLLRRIHGGVNHVGKVPARSGAAIKNRQLILELKGKLIKLIKNEEFEEAALIRDKIRELENNLGGEADGLQGTAFQG